MPISGDFSRRSLLAGITASASVVALSGCGSPAEAKSFPISLSDSEWQTRLTKMQYFVLRQEGTEPAYSSPLDNEKRSGVFHCAGCNNALFSSKTKYDSGTGWPSFWKALPNAVGKSVDYKLGYPRVEVHCADCGGHLGHMFSDGPRPTGKRYCMNGVAMKFRPA